MLNGRQKTRSSYSSPGVMSVCLSTSLTGANGGHDAGRLKRTALTLPCPGDPPFRDP